MSDEETLGDTCGIKRKIWVLIVAICFLMYGIYNCLYFLIAAYVSMFTLQSSRCHGAGCSDAVIGCAATQEASYHFRVCVMSIGSLVFGVIAINSIYNKYPGDMFKFMAWLVFSAFVYATAGIMDAGYLVLCRDHYSYNTVAETLLWPIKGLPVTAGIKYEVRQLDVYSATYINNLCYGSVGFWFAVLTVAKVTFFMYAAYEAWCLAQRFHFGEAGLGATFSIEGWRKRLAMRYEVNEVGYNTMDMAWATAMDAGWTEDEFKLQRPLRQSPYSGFPGYMPYAASHAYDGIVDDRRNVLL